MVLKKVSQESLVAAERSNYYGNGYSIIEDILLNDSMLEGVYNIARLIIKLGIHYINEDGKIHFYSSFENAEENFDK